MASTRRNRRARRWGTGMGLAAAVAVVGMGTAHADDGALPADIGLLNTAQTDIAEAFALSGHTNADANFFPELESIQTPLLSSDNSFVSGFGEALFNGPDQSLAQAGEAFLTAAQTLSSATPGITELGALGDYASTGFQVTDAIFGEIPSTIIGKLTDQIFDIGGFDTASAGAAADVAASASSAAATPDDVIGQAITELNQGTALLDAAPTADLGTEWAQYLSNQETSIPLLDSGLTQIGSVQDGLSATDQTFLAGVDEQLVTAAQNILTADQGIVVADQAGDLSGNLASNPADIPLIDADFGLVSADFTAVFDTVVAGFFTDFGIPLP
jgi:hypothetical protein